MTAAPLPWHRRLLAGLLVFALFAGLAVAMTWPLARGLGVSIRDAGDPLLNAWVLQWNLRTWRLGNWASYFDTNIFYPYDRTLAYTEHQFTEGLAALALRSVTANPILIYNLVLLLGITLAGVGAWCLARELTGDAVGATVAGIVYAFAPFPFAQLSHLQAQWSGGIPLALLFLHRLLAGREATSWRPVTTPGRWRDLAAFTLCFVLQALANGHYALYLALFVTLRVLWSLTRERRFADRRLWLQLVTFVVTAAVAVGPFFYQYWALRRELGFRRSIEYAATGWSFLATMPGNWLYGNRLSDHLRSSEDALFPGLVAFGLGVAGFLAARRPPAAWAALRRAWPDRRWRLALPGGAVLLFAAATCLLLAVATLLLWGGSWSMPGTLRPVNLLLLLAGIGWLGWRLRRRLVGLPPSGRHRDREVALFFGLMALLSFLFTFGAPGPYRLLFAFVPGFDGLRVATRFQVTLLLALGVLAAFAVRQLRQAPRPAVRVVACLLPLLVLAEYVQTPVGHVRVPIARPLPAVYRWLAHQPASTAVAELPFARPREDVARIEPLRVYASAFHWRKLVNGYSGYLSPLYTDLVATWTTAPIPETVAKLRAVGVRYLLLHLPELGPGERERWRRGLLELARLPSTGGTSPLPTVRLVRRFETTVVYELVRPARRGSTSTQPATSGAPAASSNHISRSSARSTTSQ